jgi:hypothetical protein
MRALLASVASVLLAAVPAAFAWMPPPDSDIRSPSGACVARIDHGAQRIVVSNLSGSQAWTAPGFSGRMLSPPVVVADSCGFIGIGPPGNDMIGGADRRPQTVVLRFVGRDRRERLVRLGQIYPDLSVLPPRPGELHPDLLPAFADPHVLHRGLAWDGRRWTVDTVDGRRVSFAP